MKSLTIALCCNSSFGIVNFRAGVIKALRAEGHRVVVIAPVDSYSERLKELDAEFVPWQLTGRGTGPWSELKAVRDLIGIYRRIKPDAAFHYTIKAVIYGAIAGRVTRIPCVSIITGLGYVFLRTSLITRLAQAFYRKTLRWSHEVWFLNADDRHHFDQLGLTDGATVRQLPGEGIDVDHFHDPHGLPDGDFTFLMVARLLKDKGVLEYVEAARLVKRRHPRVRFQLLGSADADNPTAIGIAAVRQWQAEGVIDYLGSTHDVRPFIASAHCGVLPSYREGIPRSLLEASAMGRPVVATDAPGCRDVVSHEVTGLLCSPRNAADLAAKLSIMVDTSRHALHTMGAAGRAMVTREFDEKLIIASYLAALSRLMPSRPGAGVPQQPHPFRASTFGGGGMP